MLVLAVYFHVWCYLQLARLDIWDLRTNSSSMMMGKRLNSFMTKYLLIARFCRTRVEEPKIERDAFYLDEKSLRYAKPKDRNSLVFSVTVMRPVSVCLLT